MADAQPTPPAVGKTASVKVDQQLYDDLQTMLATGMTVSDAVRSALRIVAGTYRKVWDADAVPQGARPTIERFWITRCDPGQWPQRGTAQTTVPTAYWLRETLRETGTTADPTLRPTAPAPGPTPRSMGLPRSYPLLPTGTTDVRPERP